MRCLAAWVLIYSVATEGALLSLVVPDLHRPVIGPQVLLMDCCFLGLFSSEVATLKWCMASHLQVNTSIIQAFWNTSTMVKTPPSWDWSSCLFGWFRRPDPKHIFVYDHIYIHMCVCVHTCIYIILYVHIYIYTLYVYIYIYTHYTYI